ncbi:hypothetical protein [Flavobacterium sp. J27]|uniref:hypothetical protein n=1 Tax=Flavobacterium sp. J27 TaxID=2060419 RepID=UPI001030CDD4|nr:hypothetical protein [Flavobacterium sp. J27]
MKVDNIENKKKTFREIVIESSVIISSIILFLGFLKQYWYYNNFSVEIQNYLSIEEVLIMFLGELPFVLKLIFFAILYHIFLILFVMIVDFIKHRFAALEDINTSFNLDSLFKNRGNLIRALILSVFLSVIALIFFIYSHSEYAVIYLVLMLCQTFYLIFDLIEINIEQQVINFILIVLSLFIVLYCKNIIDVEKVLHNPTQVKCFLNNESKQSISKPNILVGKTKDFLFFYNESKRTTRIVKIEDVVEIEYIK